MQASVPHLQIPVRSVAGALATVEQDSDQDVQQCVQTVCSYAIGDREDLPGFGINAYALRQLGEVTPDAIALDVAEWEPRADIVGTTTDVAPFERIIELTARRLNQ